MHRQLEADQQRRSQRRDLRKLLLLGAEGKGHGENADCYEQSDAQRFQ